jgi:hypothetical protein
MDPDDSVSQQIDQAKTLGDLLAVVPAMNRKLGTPDIHPLSGWLSDDLPERLERWLKQLREKLATIAKDADSYSITVGAPVGVSVTVTFRSGNLKGTHRPKLRGSSQRY